MIEAVWNVMILLNQGSLITSINIVISKINIRYFHNLYLTQMTTCCELPVGGAVTEVAQAHITVGRESQD